MDGHRAVATSPAVGYFQPRSEISSGTRVRAGDRLGIVDVLGVPQDVVSPVDGIVGASLVESGEAVEYGQELIRIELASVRSARDAAAGDPATVDPDRDAVMPGTDQAAAPADDRGDNVPAPAAAASVAREGA
jgi:pyruvate/2-oxoglutarate dehydrogenase complex dihydrolipoamide acyltransferase (E2) component